MIGRIAPIAVKADGQSEVAAGKAHERSHAGHPALSARDMLAHHRSLGNQAVGRLIRQPGVGSLPPKVVSSARECLVVPAKITINKPNDVYEQEADRVADQVMRMPEREVDGNKVDSRSRITQSEIKNPQSAIQLKPG